ncbi:MAG: efflux RND transporter periplasmic adaptor subunit [Candidatus Promineifilaceae bacterium]|jgi:HlyD family secretion protein
MRRSWIVLFALMLFSSVFMSACSSLSTSLLFGDNAADESESELQTAPVRQGDITLSATGAGTIVPAEEIVVGFKSGGILQELLVSVGDEVKAGDVLARLDNTAALQQVANAELQMTQAIMQTDAQSTETGVSFNDLSVEQAQLSLEQAQRALDELLNWQPDEDEIAQAEAGLAAAKAGYNAAVGQESASSSELTLKQMDVDDAQEAVAEAQEAYDTAFDPGREWELYIDDPSCRTGEQYPNCTGEPYSDNIKRERDSAESAVKRAQENLKVAQINYDAAVSGTNYSSSVNAQNSVLSAELALKAAQEGPSKDEIVAAQTAVRQAELAHQQALLNRELDEKIGVAQAELTLQEAQDALAATELTAPADGTVMAITANPGEMVGSGELITLADLSQPILEIYLDETDLDKISVDYEVDVTFDALPDDIFTGHVIEVDPMLTNLNGVSVVHALVRLDEDSFSKPQTLPVGLNASVEVIGGRAENVLLVPVEALREVSLGQYAVFVLGADGEPELRFVEVGLMDISFAEITSGLEMGDTVTTGLVETN